MPQVDYSQGMIYKIVPLDPEVEGTYVGSTTNFRKRKYQHKNKCTNPNDRYYNLPLYQFIRENGGWENFSMVLVENYPCNSKLELEKREREVIEEINPKLNKEIPTRTQKENFKNWYEQNKEYIRQQNSEKITCVFCGAEISKPNKFNHQKTKKCQKYQ